MTVVIRDNFIVSGDGPAIEVQGGNDQVYIVNCHFWNANTYTPRFFRRGRVHRLAPLARRARASLALWRWLG